MKQYDTAYKSEICKRIVSGQAKVATLSRETGVPENTLYKWVSRYRENTGKPFVGSGYILPENVGLVRLIYFLFVVMPKIRVSPTRLLGVVFLFYCFMLI